MEAARRRAGEPYACSGRRSRRQRAAPPVRCAWQRAFKATRPATTCGRESCYGEVFGALWNCRPFLLVSYRPLAHARRRNWPELPDAREFLSISRAGFNQHSYLTATRRKKEAFSALSLTESQIPRVGFLGRLRPRRGGQARARRPPVLVVRFPEGQGDGHRRGPRDGGITKVERVRKPTLCTHITLFIVGTSSRSASPGPWPSR